jgi:hypothetical protein
MATYLPGVTDTGLDPVQFNPNFPYMMNALQKATSTYDTNYNKIAQGYSSILNAPLSVSENVVVRDQYTKEAKDKLQALASADLSIQSNVDEADKVFSPFWEDKDILTDYNKTTQINAQNKIHETLLTSSKEEDRKRAWSQGNTYVNLSRQELAQAKRGDGSIQKVNVRGYVPYINVTNEMNKELNAMGFKDGITLVSNGNNGYIMKMTNGEKTTVIYQDVAARLMQNHPEWQDIFKVQGTNEFYGSVLNRRDQLGEDETTARRNVLESFRDSSLKAAEKGMINANQNVNKLEREFNELEAKLKIDGKIGASSDKLAIEYLNKKTELESAQSAYNYYKKNKEEFSSDDFYKANELSTFNGESYFARMFQDRFIEDYSKIRASAVSQDVKFDDTYNAAKAQENARYLAQGKYNQDQYVDANNDGIIGEGDYKLGSGPNNLQAKATAAGSKTKTTQEQLDTPTAQGIYGKQDATSYGQSYYNNLMSTGAEKGQEFTAAGINLIQSIPAFARDYNPAALSTYLDALSSVIQTGKYPVGVDKESLKQTYNQLKNNKVLPAEIPNYDELPSLQLKYMTDAALNKAKENNYALTTEQANNYLKYENSGKDFIAFNKIRTDIEKEINKDPLLKAYTEKGENEVLKKYLMDKNNDVPFLGMKDFKTLNNILYTDLKTGELKKHTVTPEYIISNIVDGNYKQILERKGSQMEYDGIIIGDKKYSYNTSGSILDKILRTISVDETIFFNTTFGLIKNIDKERKNIKDKVSELKSKLTAKVSAYLNDENIENAVMSRGLRLSTNLDEYEDKAQLLTKEVIVGNLKPLNYNIIVENVGDSEVVDNALNSLTVNSENIAKSISSTETALAGKGGNAVTKITLNMEALKKVIPEDVFKKNQAGFAAIMQFGLEYQTSKPIFRKYFRDEYMAQAVENEKLKNGISASPFVKENLHYDYTITLGANDTYVVSYGTKIIDPNTNKEDWTYRPDNIIFPRSLGLNAVTKIIQEEGYNNTVAINNYRKSLSQQSSVRKMLPNETADQYAQRLIRMSKGQ